MERKLPILVFLDDERYADDVTWIKIPEHFGLITFRKSKDFFLFVDEIDDVSKYIFSFDHDLQDFDDCGNESTGYDCIKYLVEHFSKNNLCIDNLNAISHTMNCVGRENINSYINNAKLHLR